MKVPWTSMPVTSTCKGAHAWCIHKLRRRTKQSETRMHCVVVLMHTMCGCVDVHIKGEPTRTPRASISGKCGGTPVRGHPFAVTPAWQCVHSSRTVRSCGKHSLTEKGGPTLIILDAHAAQAAPERLLIWRTNPSQDRCHCTFAQPS